jgi:hypothetical protein
MSTNAARSWNAAEWDGLAIVEKTYQAPIIHPLLKGTVDFGYVSRKFGIFLRDYKNGEGSALRRRTIRQLLYYAFLLVLAGDIPRDMPVNLGIVQPNFYGIFEDVIPWITTVGYVLDWGYNVLLPVMWALQCPAYEPKEADAVPGDHCQFCPVLIDCPKMQKAFRTYADASEDFVTMLTNEELDELYSQREYARRFMKVLKAHRARAHADWRRKIPSAKLVEKQGCARLEAWRRRGDPSGFRRKGVQAEENPFAGRRRKALVARQGIGAWNTATSRRAPAWSSRRSRSEARSKAERQCRRFAEHAARAMEEF